jgi:hypothetical protein
MAALRRSIHHQRAACHEMPIAFGRHNSIKVFQRSKDELDAPFLELGAMELVRKGQGRGDRAHVNAAVELVLADGLKPVQPVPVGGCEQVLSHGRHLFPRRQVATVLVSEEVGAGVGVGEMEHGLGGFWFSTTSELLSFMGPKNSAMKMGARPRGE